jgi:hypothetical protein
MHTLLKDPRVIKEIERFKWLESEKLGYDIGSDTARETWVSRFAAAWETAHIKNNREPVAKKELMSVDKSNVISVQRKSMRKIARRRR